MISDSTSYITYYPTNYTLYGEDAAREIVAGSASPTSIYSHTPYCRSICPFCNYSKFELRRDVSDVVDYMLREVGLWADSGMSFRNVSSVYLGGGSPSVIAGDRWSSLVNELLQLSARDLEVGIEVHPRDGSKDYFRQLRDAGFTRVSLGIQSFDDGTLSALGSHHDAADAVAALEAAQIAGFENIALDLLFLVPGQSLKTWKADLRKATDSGAKHISTYRLMLDPAGPLGRRIRLGRTPPQDLNLERAMAEEALDVLPSEGLRHYGSCSSTGFDFAQPGYESTYEVEHRAAPQGDLLAIGAGASGYLSGVAYWTIHTEQQYREAIDSGRLPVLCASARSTEEAMRRYAVLGFKHLALPLTPFEAAFSTRFLRQFESAVEPLVAEQLANVRADSIELTREGILRMDGIARLFHSEQSGQFGQPYRPQLQMISLTA